MKYFFCLMGVCVLLAGCSTAPKPRAHLKSPGTIEEQMDAARKVVGGMAGRELSREDVTRVVRDVQKNQDSRDAVSKILGTNNSGRPAVKYSPATGKHYSGELDVDPETGVKLEILPE